MTVLKRPPTHGSAIGVWSESAKYSWLWEAASPWCTGSLISKYSAQPSRRCGWTL